MASSIPIIDLKRLGIISALEDEQKGVIEHMTEVSHITSGQRRYVCGKLGLIDCILVLSRWGKVAAAATTTALIERFDVSHVLFTGVAGGIRHGLSVGDIILATELVQHDMNAHPLFPRYEIPMLGVSRFTADLAFNQLLADVVQDVLEKDMISFVTEEMRRDFGMHSPRLHQGLIGSGDEFVNSSQRVESLRSELPDLLAVEMEGAAVAQVCFEYGRPFAVLRTLSDVADDDSHVDFPRFVKTMASPIARAIILRLTALSSRTSALCPCGSNTCTIVYTANGTPRTIGITGTQYENNQQCRIILDATAVGRPIRLVFTSFSMETNYDYVRVYDGPSETAPLIPPAAGASGAMTGDLTSLPTLTTSSTVYKMLIVHSTDGSVVRNGWSASYQALVGGCPGCNTLNCITPVTASPTAVTYGITSDYSNNMACGLRITAQPGFRVRVTFTSLVTEANFDFLRVYDGSSESSPLYASYHGNLNSALPSPISASSGSMFLRFSTDGSVTAAGWTISYVAVPLGCPCGSTSCDLSVPSSLTESRLLSLVAPYYSASSSCGFILDAGASGRRISINFTQFDTEVTNDYIRIFDGPQANATLYPQLFLNSGSKGGIANWMSTSGRITSTQRYMYILSSTNGNGVLGSGWRLSHQALESNEPSIAFNSPSGSSSGSSSQTFFVGDVLTVSFDVSSAISAGRAQCLGGLSLFLVALDGTLSSASPQFITALPVTLGLRTYTYNVVVSQMSATDSNTFALQTTCRSVLRSYNFPSGVFSIRRPYLRLDSPAPQTDFKRGVSKISINLAYRTSASFVDIFLVKISTGNKYPLLSALALQNANTQYEQTMPPIEIQTPGSLPVGISDYVLTVQPSGQGTTSNTLSSSVQPLTISPSDSEKFLVVDSLNFFYRAYGGPLQRTKIWVKSSNLNLLTSTLAAASTPVYNNITLRCANILGSVSLYVTQLSTSTDYFMASMNLTSTTLASYNISIDSSTFPITTAAWQDYRITVVTADMSVSTVSEIFSAGSPGDILVPLPYASPLALSSSSSATTAQLSDQSTFAPTDLLIEKTPCLFQWIYVPGAATDYAFSTGATQYIVEWTLVRVSTGARFPLRSLVSFSKSYNFTAAPVLGPAAQEYYLETIFYSNSLVLDPLLPASITARSPTFSMVSRVDLQCRNNVEVDLSEQASMSAGLSSGIIKGSFSAVLGLPTTKRYPNSAQCQWSLPAPPTGKYWQLSIDYSLEQNFDVLQVKEAGSTTLLKSFSGSSRAARFSSDSALSFTFRSDSSVSSSGFDATFTAVNCPEACSAHGLCVPTIAVDPVTNQVTSTFTCQCNSGWSGDDCSQASDCSILSSCSSCNQADNCGWCSSTSSCLDVDVNTGLPDNGTCSLPSQGFTRTCFDCSQGRDCYSCGNMPNCGFCQSSGLCLEGSGPLGPAGGSSCASGWFPDTRNCTAAGIADPCISLTTCSSCITSKAGCKFCKRNSECYLPSKLDSGLDNCSTEPSAIVDLSNAAECNCQARLAYGEVESVRGRQTGAGNAPVAASGPFVGKALNNTCQVCVGRSATATTSCSYSPESDLCYTTASTPTDLQLNSQTNANLCLDCLAIGSDCVRCVDSNCAFDLQTKTCMAGAASPANAATPDRFALNRASCPLRKK